MRFRVFAFLHFFTVLNLVVKLFFLNQAKQRKIMRKRENPKICTDFVVVYNSPKRQFLFLTARLILLNSPSPSQQLPNTNFRRAFKIVTFGNREISIHVEGYYTAGAVVNQL